MRAVLVSLFTACSTAPVDLVQTFPTSPRITFRRGAIREPCVGTVVERLGCWLTGKPRTCLVATIGEADDSSWKTCSHAETSHWVYVGDRSTARQAPDGTARLWEDARRRLLIIDDAGIREELFVNEADDGGAPIDDLETLVRGAFWRQDLDRQERLFATASASTRVEILKTRTPHLEEGYDFFFEKLAADERNALLAWQRGVAFPSDGGVPESSIISWLTEHPELWTPELMTRAKLAWDADRARAVLVRVMAMAGKGDAERKLCESFAQAPERVEALDLAIVAVRRIECAWVPEVVRRVPNALGCTSDQSTAAARELASSVPTHVPQLRAPDVEPACSPARAALEAQPKMPADLVSRLARLDARIEGDEDCLDPGFRERVVALPPEVTRYVDPFDCVVTIDDARRRVTVKERSERLVRQLHQAQ